MSAVINNPLLILAGAQSGRVTPSLGGITVGVFRLPTDPLGYATATFDGVNANSEVRVYRLTGEELAGVELCAANPTLVWGVYASPDTVVIRIVNVLYKIKEFTLNVNVGTLTIPVQQELDKWYSNPA